MADPFSKLLSGWFDAAVLKALAWMTIPLITLSIYFGDKYVSMEVKLATAVQAEDLTKFEAQIREDMRKAVQDGMTTITARQISDELRLAALEARR